MDQTPKAGGQEPTTTETVPRPAVRPAAHGLRLSKAFWTTPEFWLNEQLMLDLYRTLSDEKEIGELERM